MIVYGDHDIELTQGEALAHLVRRVCNMRDPSLVEARARLIFAGQIEQALEDAQSCAALTARAMTRAAAEAFLASRNGELALASARSSAMRTSLTALSTSPDAHATLRVRTPEGFAWYALYPDAYAQAAECWAAASGAEAGGSVLVVGVRSIGTTLAAVVAAVLRMRGYTVQDITVRPEGHPFARRCEVAALGNDFRHAIVVDEGPGLSGSSLASVAAALVARGVRTEHLTFLVGHTHGPGCEGSAETRAWWARIPAHAVPWPQLGWQRGELAQSRLRKRAAALLGEAIAGPLRDIGGGRWQAELRNAPPTPPHDLAPRLEAPKLLARGVSGRRLLLKFSGLAMARPDPGCNVETLSERQARKMGSLADRGLSPAPLATEHGWIALPWQEGERIMPSSGAAMLARLALQITEASGLPLGAGEAGRANERLREMLVANARELLGESAADVAARAGDRLAPPSPSGLPSYGDGRLAPREWIKTAGGILKLDAGGHDHDHTIVGPQPVTWDIAGAIVEWELDSRSRRQLLELTRIAVSARELAWTCASYAAFRAGIAHLCATTSQGRDAAHASRARTHYRRHLQSELARLDAAGDSDDP